MTTVTVGGYVYVDDTDLSVVYSDGWGVSNTEYAWHGTLHAASKAGLTASITFKGTYISVVGGGGDTNQFGYPSTSYVIDGKNYKTLVTGSDASHDAYFDNVTMFTSPTLPEGEHTLVITNLNGTKPNTFWLDYFWYPDSEAVFRSASSSNLSASSRLTSTSSSSTLATGASSVSSSLDSSRSSSNSAASSSSTTTSGSSLNTAFSSSGSSRQQPFSASTASQGASSAGIASGSSSASPSAPSTTAGNDKDLSAGGSSTSQHVGAIVGGAIGGAVLLALLVILAVYLFLRHRLRYQSTGDDIYKYKMQRDTSPEPDTLFSASGYPHTPSLPPDPFASDPSSEISRTQIETAAPLLAQHPRTPESLETPAAGIFMFRPVTKDRGEYSPLSRTPDAPPAAADTSPPPYFAS
ncbi:hypothetical protein BN946_scf184747.g59 [Trametes cinnabarina]|uniref:Uncharacterized protein n=1 Tax=Pycnoporus cinnabarinus TaxID=5643 RepID=A0A060SSX1_PYCCI|nr:hypothetical protein BN946_scf184747.g59 [Trametes cinnabarina]